MWRDKTLSLDRSQEEEHPSRRGLIYADLELISVCNAAVLPGETEVLLGSVPMEDMDLVLYPQEERMDINPATPYVSKRKIKSGV